MKAKVRFALLLAGIAVFFGGNALSQSLSSSQVLGLINGDRMEHGLSLLEPNPILSLAAYAKAQDMIKKNYFAHTSPDGTKPWDWFRALGYNYTYAGENLAEGFSDPAELVDSWMASPTHRANILSPFYSDIGLAVIKQDNISLVVQFFGSKENKVTLRQ